MNTNTEHAVTESWKVGALAPDMVGKFCACVRDENGWEVAYINAFNQEKAEHRARLIAAAPDLLKACKAARDILDRITPLQITQGGLCEEQDALSVVRNLQRVIANAESR